MQTDRTSSRITQPQQSANKIYTRDVQAPYRGERSAPSTTSPSYRVADRNSHHCSRFASCRPGYRPSPISRATPDTTQVMPDENAASKRTKLAAGSSNRHTPTVPRGISYGRCMSRWDTRSLTKARNSKISAKQSGQKHEQLVGNTHRHMQRGNVSGVGEQQLCDRQMCGSVRGSGVLQRYTGRYMNPAGTEHMMRIYPVSRTEGFTIVVADVRPVVKKHRRNGWVSCNQ